MFRRAALWTHRAFYACLVLLPVTGAVAWFRGIPAAGDAHEVLRAVLLALIALHLGGVAMHQLVWKTDILKRMIRPSKDPRQAR
jgi:cytochrome b561